MLFEILPGAETPTRGRYWTLKMDGKAVAVGRQEGNGFTFWLFEFDRGGTPTDVRKVNFCRPYPGEFIDKVLSVMSSENKRVESLLEQFQEFSDKLSGKNRFNADS